MTKKVYMFGPNSLNKAQQHVANHPASDLVILKDPQTRRIAVCTSAMAQSLRDKGFKPLEVEN